MGRVTQPDLCKERWDWETVPPSRFRHRPAYNLKCPNTPGERGGREASEREKGNEKLKQRYV